MNKIKLLRYIVIVVGLILITAAATILIEIDKDTRSQIAYILGSAAFAIGMFESVLEYYTRKNKSDK